MYIERDPNKAKKMLEKAFEIFEHNFGRNNLLVSRILHDLATVSDNFHEFEKSIGMHKEAVNIRIKVRTQYDNPFFFFFVFQPK